MLLRVEDLSAFSGLDLANAFILGDQIICVSKQLDKHWRMYTIDAHTFAVRELTVSFENSIFRPYWDNVHFPVNVHNGVAYARCGGHFRVMAGTLDKDHIHWRVVETTGAPEELRNPNYAINYSEGDLPFFTLLCVECDRDNVYICRLELSTARWTYHKIAEHEIANAGLSLQQMFSLFRRTRLSKILWTLNDKVHLFLPTEDDKNEHHLMMDTRTKNWSAVIQVTPFCTRKRFVHKGKMYKIDQDESKYAVHRFEEHSNEWIKVCNIGEFASPISRATDMAVMGSRVFVFDVIKRGSKRILNKLYVIEMDPTLLDIAMAATLRDARLKRTGEQYLPSVLRKRLHRDTTGDSLVPAKRRWLDQGENDEIWSSDDEEDNGNEEDGEREDEDGIDNEAEEDAENEQEENDSDNAENNEEYDDENEAEVNGNE